MLHLVSEISSLLLSLNLAPVSQSLTHLFLRLSHCLPLLILHSHHPQVSFTSGSKHICFTNSSHRIDSLPSSELSSQTITQTISSAISIFTARRLPRDWKHRSGRPRHNWLRTVESDLSPLNTAGSGNRLNVEHRIDKPGAHSYRDGNVQHRTSHTMMMMMMTLVLRYML